MFCVAGVRDSALMEAGIDQIIIACDQAVFFSRGKGEEEKGGKIMPDTFILRAANCPHYK